MSEQIDKAIAKFPQTFGLRGFPNSLFRISRFGSYVNDDGIVMLYTQRLVVDEKPAHSMLGFQGHNDRWLDFAKCTTEELFSQITRK